MISVLLAVNICAGVVGAVPLPVYPLAAPVQTSIAQDALIIQATRRWYMIDKGRIMRPSERLWQLLRTRPVIQYDRIDGSLFVEILVSRGGYAIIADGLASLLCTQLGPAKEIAKNSFWYDRPIWQIQLEITAKWAKKWKPLTRKQLFQGVDPTYALSWRKWVKGRIGKEALSAHIPKTPKPGDDIWGYAALAGGNTGKAIVKATLIGHKTQIRNLEEQAIALDYGYRRRYSNLYIRWINGSNHADYIDCEGRGKAKRWISDAQFQHCRVIVGEIRELEAAMSAHRKKRPATYTRIRKMRQAIEFHKRGLIEANKALEIEVAK